MVIKSNYRQAWKKPGVGETYGQRSRYQRQLQKNEEATTSLFGKIRDFFRGTKATSTIQQFAAKASYVPNGAKAITEYLKETELGLNDIASASDNDLLAILNSVEKSYK